MARDREALVATLDGSEWQVVIHPVARDEWRVEAVSPPPSRQVTPVEGRFTSHGAALREGLRLADRLRRERTA